MSVDTDMNISPVLGTGGADILTGTGRSEVLSGAGGNDTIQGLSGNDEIFGGVGDDLIFGQGGDDTIYGNGKPAYVDLNNLVMVETTTATVTFMDEGAGYRNSLGVYEINPDGSFGNVQVLFPNASKTGSGGNLLPGQSQVTFDVTSGAQLGFFVVSNGYGKGIDNREALDSLTGTFELRDGNGNIGTIDGGPVTLWYIDPLTSEEYEVQSQYGADIFHSTATGQNGYALNPDNYLHVVGRANAVSGELLIGFEDLYGGGDNDYDDTVILVNIGQNNVVAQLPESSGSAGPVEDDDTLYGGDGADTIYGIGGDDIIDGGSGNDDLFGNSGNDILRGSAGNDKLEGQAGDDDLAGGSGQDELKGGSGNDILSGGGDNDILEGGSGTDQVHGGSGDDILSGNSGDDHLYGDNGNDILNGNSGNDSLYGGFGGDTLNGHSGNDVLYGEAGSDEMIGGGGNDTLYGGDHNDRIYGGADNDTLYGEDGNDYLSAGTGDDILSGGIGSDKLFGGSGADQFILGEFTSGDRDVIADFASGDVVNFSGLNLGSFELLMAFSEQSGDTAVFHFDDNYTVVFNDYDVSSFVDGDFVV